jgi:hypothetical protein
MTKKEAVRGRRQNGGLGRREVSEAKAKVEAFVGEQSPVQRKTINRLRALVKGAFPELEERMRWSQVGYLVLEKDVCGIYPSSGHVNLSFWQGSALSDPKGLLEGTGKGMRHIKISKVEDVGEETIRAYVREAVAFVRGPGQSTRTSQSC